MTEKKTKKPRLTLQWLLKNDLAVWVRNKTGDPDSKHPPGLISMQVGWGDSVGKVVIPPGDDPVCITDQVDPSSLKSCRDLFECIRREGLELLDPEKAEEYYEKNEERRKTMNEKINDYLSGKKDDVALPGEVQRGNVGQLHPQIGDICQKARHNAANERQTLERLIEQAKAFGEEDFRYVANNGHYKSVKRWAEEQLSSVKKRKSDPVESHLAHVANPQG